MDEIPTIPLHLRVLTKGGYPACVMDYYLNNKTMPFIGFIEAKQNSINVGWDSKGICLGGEKMAYPLDSLDIPLPYLIANLAEIISSLSALYVKLTTQK